MKNLNEKVTVKLHDINGNPRPLEGVIITAQYVPEIQNFMLLVRTDEGEVVSFTPEVLERSDKDSQETTEGQSIFKVGDIVRIDSGDLEYRVIKRKGEFYTLRCLWPDAPFPIVDGIYAPRITFIRSSSKKR